MTRPPRVVADLTFARINGGWAYGYLDDEDRTPTKDQRVLVTDGGSQQAEGVIVGIDADGTLMLRLPAYENRVRASGLDRELEDGGER